MPNITIFISDLHLHDAKPKITQLFRDFLKDTAPEADALYILGDFFDAWIGDDDVTDYNKSIQQDIKQLVKTGVPVFIVPGNRDFLLGDKFAQASGCRILTDPSCIDLYGTPTVLTHGDMLCTKDTIHIVFRKLVNSVTLKKIFLFLPLELRRFIANTVRKISSSKKRKKYSSPKYVSKKVVTKLLQQFDAKQIIHGHLHKAEMHESNECKRIVLGEWHKKPSILIYPENHQPYFQK